MDVLNIALARKYTDAQIANLTSAAVKEAEDAIIAAGEVAAQSVAQSIDSTLSVENKAADAKKVGEEVSAIKADLNSINMGKIADTKCLGFLDGEYSNGYIDSSGELYNTGNTNWKTTNFIPVEEGQTLAYSLIGYGTTESPNPVYIITAYDSEKTRIANDSVIGNNVTIKNGIYTVAEGTAYIRISGNKKSFGFYSEDIAYGYFSINESINDALGYANYQTFPGYINNDGGTSGEGSTTKEVYTTLIPVTPNSTEFDIEASFSSAVDNWFAIANFSSSLGFISREVIINENAQTKSITKAITNTSVAFVILTWRTYNEDAVTIRVKPNKIGDSGSSIEIDDTAGAGATDKVWSANKTYLEINNAKSDINTVVLPENSGYINANGTFNSASSSGNEVYTDIMPVESGDIISIVLSYGSSKSMWLAYATYDENREFITRTTLVNNVTQQTATETITVGSSVKFIRITYRTYDSHAITISTTGKAREVSDLIIHSANELIENAKYPLVLGELINAQYVSADDSWNIGNSARLAVISTQYTDVAIPITIGAGYAVDIQTRTAEGAFSSETGWKTQAYTIPAETYFTLLIKKTSEADITPTEGIKNVYLGASDDNQLSVSYGIIAQKMASIENAMISLSSNVKAVNHRGYNIVAPENTIPALLLSRKNGFCYVECDVEYTSDGVPVILHDSTINRTGRNADGTSISSTINIGSITYEEALAYDFGIYKGNAYAGTKIPTLKQFVETCRMINVHPYIEIKEAGSTQALVESCAEIVRNAGMWDKVTWVSFSDTCLGYIKNKEPKARLGLVVNSVASGDITKAEALKTNENEVFIDSGSYTSAEIERCVDAGLHLEVWTINNTATFLELDPYISGITSDRANASYLLYKNKII